MATRKQKVTKKIKLLSKITRRQSTPTRVSAAPRSDGLVLQVGFPEIDAVQAKDLVRSLVSELLLGDWEIYPLDGTTREFILRRPADQQNPTVAQAFDMAAKLCEHRDVDDCEPSLVLPSEPSEEIAAERSMFELPESVRTLRSSSSGSSGTPAACSIDNEWVLSYCKVREAWALPVPSGGKSMGEGILVAHPDTGYTRHPELDADRVLAARGRNYEEGNNDPLDPLTGRFGGHGTSTGSVIMSGKGPGTSDAIVTGVAPRAKLVPLRVTNSVVLSSFAKLNEAVRYAGNQGFHVLSISLGGPPLAVRHLRRAVRYAVERGLIVVAAAGNRWPFVVYPARLDEVIAVAATDCHGQVWRDSASGSSVDVAAPGDAVWRALSEPVDQFSVGPSSGTSYATAMVAGAAALWLAFHGRDRLIDRYGAANLAGVFKETLLRYGFDRPSGWNRRRHGVGILNVQKLLQAPLPVRAAAGGTRALHASPVPRLANDVDHFLELFPTSSRTTVQDRLCEITGATPTELNENLSEMTDELCYHAVMDRDFRHSLMQDADGPAADSPARSARRTAGNTRQMVTLPARMSRELRKRLSEAEKRTTTPK